MLQITAPPGLSQSDCNKGLEEFRKNPVENFSSALETALGIKKGKYLADSEPRSHRRAHFRVIHECMDLIIRNKVFDFVKDQDLSGFDNNFKNRLNLMYSSGQIMEGLALIGSQANQIVQQKLSSISFSNVTPKVINFIKGRLKDGFENMFEKFQKITGLSMVLSLRNSTSNVMATFKQLISNNFTFIKTISNLRQDVFNKLADFIIQVSANNATPNDVEKHWIISNANSSCTLSPTENLFKDIVEAYPYNYDTEIVNQIGSTLNSTQAPSFGCPALNISFTGGGNIIKGFYEWYLKALENFFL